MASLLHHHIVTSSTLVNKASKSHSDNVHHFWMNESELDNRSSTGKIAVEIVSAQRDIVNSSSSLSSYYNIYLLFIINF